MSFLAYLTTITAKPGKTPAEFRQLAPEKEFTDGTTLNAGVTAAASVQWLKDDFDLGHGHAMAIYALLKGTKTETSD